MRYSLKLDPRRLMLALWMVVGGLLALHIVLTVIHYTVTELPWLLRQLFDVDEEDSIPTWYSTSALLLTSVIVWLLARRKRVEGNPHSLHWQGLALGFAALSLDEIAGLHETLNSAIEMSWAIPGAIVAALVAGAYLTFLASIPRSLAGRFILAGALYLGGALGVEWATDVYAETDALDTLAYNLWTAVEEGMEMAGVLVFLSAVLTEMRQSPADQMMVEVELPDSAA